MRRRQSRNDLARTRRHDHPYGRSLRRWGSSTTGDFRLYFPLWRRPRQLVPLSRRFVPEPVEMTYIVTDVVVGSFPDRLSDLPGGTLSLGLAACTPSAIRQITELTPSYNVCASPDIDFQRICSICGRGAAEIRPVRHVTLQTRLRRPYWADTEAFRAFINDRIVPAELNVCRNCRWRCGMELLGEVA